MQGQLGEPGARLARDEEYALIFFKSAEIVLWKNQRFLRASEKAGPKSNVSRSGNNEVIHL